MTSPEHLTQPAASTSAYRALLGDKNYRYFFSATFISTLGDWMGFVALPIIVAGLFREGSQAALFALGGVLMLRLLPSAVFGPIAGIVADRYDRKKLIVVTDLIRCGLFIGITFSFDLWLLFALTFLVECLSLLFLSAKDAAVPTLVGTERLTEANQLNLLVSYGTMPLGAVGASAMIAVATALSAFLPFDVDPLRLALFFDALTYLVSASLMTRVTISGSADQAAQARAADDRPGILAELREGLAFIRNYPTLRALIFGITGVFFGAGAVIGLGPEFVRADLGRPGQDWSLLISAVGGGLVLGIAALVPLLRRWTMLKVFPTFLAITGGLAFVIALMPSFALVMVVGVALGAAAGVSVVKGYTLLQQHTQDATRGRTFAAFYTLTRLALFVSLGAGPFIAGAIGRLSIGTDEGELVLSGIRFTLLLGAAVAFWSALRARRAIFGHLGDDDEMVLGGSEAPDHPGLLVAFEGVEGSGKSTQIERLAERLRAEGHDVATTREPGGSPLAERVRDLLLDPNGEGMTDRTEALLLAAARADHVQRVIRPALEEGKIVLVDRYVESSLAYQGHARGLGIHEVHSVNRWAVEGHLADVVVLLELDPAEGLRRVQSRVRSQQADATRRRHAEEGLFELPRTGPVAGTDRIEREGLDFHRRVARGYLDLARHDDGRFLVVDASGAPDDIAAQIRAGLHRWVPLPDRSHDGEAPDRSGLLADLFGDGSAGADRG